MTHEAGLSAPRSFLRQNADGSWHLAVEHMQDYYTYILTLELHEIFPHKHFFHPPRDEKQKQYCYNIIIIHKGLLTAQIIMGLIRGATVRASDIDQ